MRLFQLLIFLVFSSCVNKEQPAPKEPAESTAPVVNTKTEKTYDTLSNGLRIINHTDPSEYYYKDLVSTDSLTGNYQVIYAEDDTSYYLYLKHGNTLALLNQTTNSTSLHHLGVADEDHPAYFLLVHDNGNGSPESYEYIDKRTGKNPLGYGKEFLDYRMFNQTPYVLYDDIKDDRNMLVLWNARNNKKEWYELNDNRVQVLMDTVTFTHLKISYTTDLYGDSLKTKTYRR